MSALINGRLAGTRCASTSAVAEGVTAGGMASSFDRGPRTGVAGFATLHRRRPAARPRPQLLGIRKEGGNVLSDAVRSLRVRHASHFPQTATGPGGQGVRLSV